MANHGDRKRGSLCEKSMQMVVSIVKLSSLSLAAMNLGTTRRALKAGVQPSITSLELSQLHGRRKKKAQEPDRYSYLTEKGGSSYVINGLSSSVGFHANNQIELNSPVSDGEASDYIRRFHEKSQHEFTGSSKSLPFILPPPPPQPK